MGYLPNENYVHLVAGIEMEEEILKLATEYQKDPNPEKLEVIIKFVNTAHVEEIYSTIQKSPKVLDFLTSIFLGKLEKNNLRI